MVKTAMFAGQGYIYRCPKCKKVDRQGHNKFPETFTCRFCEHVFPVENELSPKKGGELWKVYDEICGLETGRDYKDGAPTGQPYFDADSYFGRNNQQRFKQMAKTAEGMQILEKLITIIKKSDGKKFKNVQDLLDSDGGTPNEYVAEAQMWVLIDKHNAANERRGGGGLSPMEKVNLLKHAGYDAFISEETGNCAIFFNSTVAPECDYWVEWK